MWGPPPPIHRRAQSKSRRRRLPWICAGSRVGAEVPSTRSGPVWPPPPCAGRRCAVGCRRRVRRSEPPPASSSPPWSPHLEEVVLQTIASPQSVRTLVGRTPSWSRSTAACPPIGGHARRREGPPVAPSPSSVRLLAIASLSPCCSVKTRKAGARVRERAP
jgi:hypothetical protein